MKNYIEEQLNVLNDAFIGEISGNYYSDEVLRFLVSKQFLKITSRVRVTNGNDYFTYEITELGKLHLYDATRTLAIFDFDCQANKRSWISLVIACVSAVVSLFAILPTIGKLLG